MSARGARRKRGWSTGGRRRCAVARTGFFSRHPADSTAEADEQMAERDRMIADGAPTARERAAAVGRAAVEERRADAERTVADERRQAEHDRMIDRDRTDDETW